MYSSIQDLFLLFHRLTAANHRPVAAACHNNFSAAFGAFISFAYLICHYVSLLK
jgi:hypothetical protein